MKDKLKTRWVVMLEKPEAENFDESDFKVVAKTRNGLDDSYYMLILEAIANPDAYTLDDIMVLTGALAVHEEWTNGILVDPDAIDNLSSDIYTWEGSGGCFLGDMLTDLEKLHFIVEYIYTEEKHYPTLDNLTIQLKQDSPKIPLKDNTEKLFTSDVHTVNFEDKNITVWWPIILEEQGLFLIIVDEDLEDEEEEPQKIYPRTDYSYLYDDDHYPWNYYDDYDYDDNYYRRT